MKLFCSQQLQLLTSTRDNYQLQTVISIYYVVILGF